jgi:site-specific recombinase XerD
MPVIDPSPASFPRLLEFYLNILDGEEVSPATIATYRQRVGNFLSTIADANLSLNQVTKLEIRLYLAKLKQRGCIASTIEAYFRALRAFFNKMVVEGILPEPSPMKGMEAPKIPKLIPRTFTHDDVYRMLALCPQNNYLGIRNRTILLIFMDTGIRLCEMTGIQLADIDKEYEMIRVYGKGAKERVVPLGKKAQKALLKYKALFRSNPDDRLPCLWLTEEGRPLHLMGIRIMIRRLIRRAGISGVKIGPHAFRHFAATNYLMNGGDKSTLKTLLGHSTYKMVDRYSGSVEMELMQKMHRNVSPVDRMRL